LKLFRPIRLPLALFILSTFSASAMADDLLPSSSFSFLIDGTFRSISEDDLFGEGTLSSKLNPASAADRQLPFTEFVFGSAIPTSSESPFGLSAFGGWSSPFSFGTLTLAGAGSYSNNRTGGLQGLPSPWGADVSVTLSKRASETLAFGAGLSWSWWRGDRSVSGFYGSLGGQASFPALLQGADLTVSLVGLGPSQSPWSTYKPYVSVTPIVSGRLKFIDSSKRGLSVFGALSSPSLSDVSVAGGLRFRLGAPLAVEISWDATLSTLLQSWNGQSTTGYPLTSAIPGLRITYDAKTLFGGRGPGISGNLSPGPSGASAQLGLQFSRGSRDVDPPRLIVGPLKETVLSPPLVKDISVPLSWKDDSAISSWEVAVYPVETTSSDPVFFATSPHGGTVPVSDGIPRLLHVVRRNDPPASILIPVRGLGLDGRYAISFVAIDSAGNRGASDLSYFDLDSVPPSATASLAGYHVFSPNDDGTRDLLPITQDGSIEREWVGRFRDGNANPIRTYRWTDGGPLSFAWDGKDDDGKTVEDGIYDYVLSSVDAAGNGVSKRISGIKVDGRPSPVFVQVAPDMIAGSAAQEGKIIGSTTISISVPRKDGLRSWKISIEGPSGQLFSSYEGRVENLDVLPQTIIFDGRNSDGDPAPDGKYRIWAELSYDNGDRPRSADAWLLIDSSAPSGQVRASRSTLDVDAPAPVVFSYILSEHADWTGELLAEDGTAIDSFDLKRGGEGEVVWSGTGVEGRDIGEGEYSFLATGLSASGVIGQAGPVRIRALAGGANISLSVTKNDFSPFIDESSGRFIMRADSKERAIGWQLSLVSAKDRTITRNLEGIGHPPASVLWDGLTDVGSQAPDGEYQGKLQVKYESGQSIISNPVSITLDTVSPEGALVARGVLFSPNGDGVLDSVSIEQHLDPSVPWAGGVFSSADGRLVRTYRWKSSPPEKLTWDGLDDQGFLCADGAYEYRLSGSDGAGNSTLLATAPIELDARIPRVSIGVDKFAFSPNGDGFADAATYTFAYSPTEGVASWRIDIVGETGTTVFSRHGTGTPPNRLVWKGEGAFAGNAPDGEYLGSLELTYTKGDKVAAKTGALVLDRTPPRVSLNAAPVPFSPDDDGVADALTFALSAQDASALSGWRLTISDPEGYPFRTFAGNGAPPSSIVWDGRSLDGELVQAATDYSWELVVRDALANVAKIEGSIPIDVFVLKDGDKLKIRISSITFAPNDASLDAGGDEVAKRNGAILSRIAAVLARFPNYSVRIEGHAVNLSGTEREEKLELEPLSLARANAVLQALVALGVDGARLEAVGVGGREPIVPHGDAQNRWKNRRVEFVLVK